MFCSARKSRVKKVREGLESSLKSRIELIESYARVRFLLMKPLQTLEPKNIFLGVYVM